MKTSKFLEEIEVLENKLCQKVGDENRRLSFPALVQQLAISQHLNEQIVSDLKKLWEFRNKIYSSLTLEDEISDENQILLLASLINNLNL